MFIVVRSSFFRWLDNDFCDFDHIYTTMYCIVLTLFLLWFVFFISLLLWIWSFIHAVAVCLWMCLCACRQLHKCKFFSLSHRNASIHVCFFLFVDNVLLNWYSEAVRVKQNRNNVLLSLANTCKQIIYGYGDIALFSLATSILVQRGIWSPFKIWTTHDAN